MVQLFVSTPRGFLTSADTLNTFEKEQLSRMSREVYGATTAQIMLAAVHHSKTNELSSKSANLGLISQALSALSYIQKQFHIVLKDETSSSQQPAEIQSTFENIITTHTSIEASTAQLITEEFLKIYFSAKDNSSLGEHLFSLGKVEKLDWRLGMSISSSNCKQISEPFITLIWDISGPTGLVSYPMEVSLAEFRQLSTTFQNLPNAMEV